MHMRYLILMAVFIAATVSEAALGDTGSDIRAAASAPTAAPAKELTLQEKVEKLQKGKTTYEEALRELGSPATKGDGPNDTQYAVWTKTGWFGGSYIARLNFKDGLLVSKFTQQN